MRQIDRFLLVAACACFVASSVIAADSPAPASKPFDVTNILPPAKLTKQLFDELINKMLDVAVMVEKQDPEAAKAIRAALDKAKQEFISENMGQVMDLLNKSINSAFIKEKDVQKALDEVLRILREGDANPNAREEYLNWLRDMKEKIGAMIEKQKDLERQSAENISPASKEMAGLMQELDSIVKAQEGLLDQTQKLQQTDPDIKNISDLRDEIDGLIARQDAMTDDTARAPIDKRPALGKLQDKIGDDTQGVKEKLDTLAKDDKVAAMLEKAGANKDALADAAKNTGLAKQGMKEASDALGKSDAAKAADPQTQAGVDLRAAKKALDDAIAKAGEKTPAGEIGKNQQALAEQTAKLGEKVQNTAAKAGQKADSANMKNASGQMSKASEQLSGQNASKAGENQKKALEELKGKKVELAQLQRKLEEKKPTTPAEQKPPQDEITKDSQAAAEDMANQAKKQGNQESPGQQNMQNASKNSSKASEGLGQNKPSDANEEQKKAIDEMQKAQDEIARAIDEEESKKDEEKLAKIDQLLTAALEKQKAMSASTVSTYAKRTGDKEYDRREIGELTALSDGEGKLQGDIGKVKKMLDDEKATVVFPVVLKDVMDKLGNVQKKLADKDAGQLTQAIQTQIEQTLEELVNSIRKQLAEHRDRAKGGGGPSGGGGGKGKQPLVPPIAELKMLRTMELQIAGITKLLDKQVVSGELPKEKAAVEFKTVTDRQKEVQRLAEEMKKKLSGPAGPKDGF